MFVQVGSTEQTHMAIVIGTSRKERLRHLFLASIKAYWSLEKKDMLYSLAFSSRKSWAIMSLSKKIFQTYWGDTGSAFAVVCNYTQISLIRDILDSFDQCPVRWQVINVAWCFIIADKCFTIWKTQCYMFIWLPNIWLKTRGLICKL